MDDPECSTEYHGPNSTVARQQQQQQQPPSWDRQSNRCAGNNTSQFATTDVDESRGKMSKTRLSAGNDVRAPPSAPTIMQYAELHFRDVGQEIDV
ncbi:unnamed protein product [Lasius platythorax]